MGVAEQRQTEPLRLSGEQDSSVAEFGASGDLGHCVIDIPEGRGDYGHESQGVGRDPIQLEVVVGLDTGQHQLAVFQLQEVLRPESSDIGI